MNAARRAAQKANRALGSGYHDHNAEKNEDGRCLVCKPLPRGVGIPGAIYDEATMTEAPGTITGQHMRRANSNQLRSGKFRARPGKWSEAALAALKGEE